MNIPDPENQQFSDSTLKGFLLKNVDTSTKNPAVKQLNEYIVKRVDTFWDLVVTPMREKGTFNGNKINWYFEIYKEGIEARRVINNPFSFINVTLEQIKEVVKFFKDKSVVEYCELGTSFLSSCYSLLSFWYRDQLVIFRLEKIYNSDNPIVWIITAEKEEHGAMTEKQTSIPELENVIKNIGLILSKRV